jgi:transcriptional regulator with XRE-family HTH domain
MCNGQSEFVSELVRRLRAERSKAGLSQFELGERLEMKAPHAQSHLSRLESGRTGEPSISFVVNDLKARGVSVAGFFRQLEQGGVLPGIAPIPMRTGRKLKLKPDQKRLPAHS